MTDRDGLDDGSVMDKVTVETLASDGLQQNDGKNDDSNLPTDHHLKIDFASLQKKQLT